ncbi:hypothetical protein AV656_11435 [Bhargavaea cecembensis]|uniref:Uncharacterized protein n=1 Tax=Bhargavaea cecembensis TaxID=394098 RepID=A0A165GPG4_9BACL|nr:hypothetical protein [Bhargavaea cecembensis]KZE37185.1 hypothetical protein AV656_11435 [Bhargavaea cecembensis]
MKKEYKIFYWELDARGKFIRSLWGHPLALAFLYWAISLPSERPIFDTVFMKVWLPLIATLVVLVDLVYLYRKWKKEEESKQ